MDNPTILGLAGGSLARPMVPDGDRSILPWKVASWHLQDGDGDNFAAAHATQVGDPYGKGKGELWRAFCAGPLDTKMPEADFPTAEAARAAVEEHIAAHVEAHLSEVAR